MIKKIFAGLIILLMAAIVMGGAPPQLPAGTKRSGTRTYIKNDSVFFVSDSALAMYYNATANEVVVMLDDTSGFGSKVASYVAAHSGSGSTDSGLVVRYATGSFLLLTGGTVTGNIVLDSTNISRVGRLGWANTGTNATYLEFDSTNLYVGWNGGMGAERRVQFAASTIAPVLNNGFPASLTIRASAFYKDTLSTPNTDSALLTKGNIRATYFPRNPTSSDSLGADVNFGGNDIQHLHYLGWLLTGLHRMNFYFDDTTINVGWQGSSGYENLWKFRQNYFGAIGGGTYSPILMAPTIYLQSLGTPVADSAAKSKAYIDNAIAAALASVTADSAIYADTAGYATDIDTSQTPFQTYVTNHAGGAGDFLPLAPGAGDSLTENVNMSGHNIDSVTAIVGKGGAYHLYTGGDIEAFLPAVSDYFYIGYGGVYKWYFRGLGFTGTAGTKVTVDTVYATTYQNLPKVNNAYASDRTDTLYLDDSTLQYWNSDTLVQQIGECITKFYKGTNHELVISNDSGITLTGGTGSPTFADLLLESDGVVSWNGLEMDSATAYEIVNKTGVFAPILVDTGAATVEMTDTVTFVEGSGIAIGANTTTGEITINLSGGTGTGVFSDSGDYYMNPTAHNFMLYTLNGSFWKFEDSLLGFGDDTCIYIHGDTMVFGNVGPTITNYFQVIDSMTIGGVKLDSTTLADLIAGNSGTVTDGILGDSLDLYWDSTTTATRRTTALAASPIVTTPTLKLAQSAGPTPTTEGVIEWNTTSGYIAVGWNGVATAVFKPVQDSSAVAINAITSWHIKNNTIDTMDIKAGGVGTSELAANSVDSTKIANSAVGTTEIASGAVGPTDVSTTGVFPFTGFYGPMTPSDVSGDPDDTLKYFAAPNSGLGVNTNHELYVKWTNIGSWALPANILPDSAFLWSANAVPDSAIPDNITIDYVDDTADAVRAEIRDTAALVVNDSLDAIRAAADGWPDSLIGWSTQYLFAECLPVWKFDTTVAMSYPYYDQPDIDTNYLFQCSSLVANDTVTGPKIRNNTQMAWDADSIIVWVQMSREDADSVKIDSLAFYITTAALHVDSLVTGNGTDRSVAGLTRYAYAFDYVVPAGSKVVTKPIMVCTEAGSWIKIVDVQVQGRPL